MERRGRLYFGFWNWSIENGVFYTRDVTMGQNRLPACQYGHPLSLLRNAALNSLRPFQRPFLPDAYCCLAAHNDFGFPSFIRL